MTCSPEPNRASTRSTAPRWDRVKSATSLGSITSSLLSADATTVESHGLPSLRNTVSPNDAIGSIVAIFVMPPSVPPPAGAPSLPPVSPFRSPPTAVGLKTSSCPCHKM